MLLENTGVVLIFVFASLVYLKHVKLRNLSEQQDVISAKILSMNGVRDF